SRLEIVFLKKTRNGWYLKELDSWTGSFGLSVDSVRLETRYPFSLLRLVPCCGSSSCEEQQPPAAEQEEWRLHVLCPDLEPSPEPLLPRPLLEDLRKRTSMAVVLWQPPLGPPGREEATAAEPLQMNRKSPEEEQEPDTSMEELPDCGPIHGNEEPTAYIGHI
ncbi:hypothetical protein V5799_024497, partial [Amblyomma americanum]